jgi:hypothetical protein
LGIQCLYLSRQHSLPVRREQRSSEERCSQSFFASPQLRVYYQPRKDFRRCDSRSEIQGVCVEHQGFFDMNTLREIGQYKKGYKEYQSKELFCQTINVFNWQNQIYGRNSQVSFSLNNGIGDCQSSSSIERRVEPTPAFTCRNN